MEYTVIRRNLKHARINVNESNEVKLIIPHHFSEKEIIDLVEMKKEWIQKQQKFFLSQTSDSFSVSDGDVMFKGEIIPTPSSEMDKWYKTQSSIYIKSRVQYLANLHNISFNRIFIRDTKSKWGSCSKQMNLSFNWRLILAPIDIIDYVILHELCHTKILKHSNAFWLRLQTICPEYLTKTKWLQVHGKSIFELADKICATPNNYDSNFQIIKNKKSL